MRFAIFLGFILLSATIEQAFKIKVNFGKSTEIFIVILGNIFIVMDTLEFFKNILKKN